ncbi:hypothetical protein VTN00DRAFT_7095 [Thermoascus crustaceus]|uniref:uncharacterized protein n=1 Tax=Thermoascus crustaceus TaxID=5088 RepID=UPI003744A026
MPPEPHKSLQSSDVIPLEDLRPVSVVSVAGTVKNFSRPFESETNLASEPVRDGQDLQLSDHDLAVPAQAMVIERSPRDQIHLEMFESLLSEQNTLRFSVSPPDPDPNGFDNDSTSRMAILGYQITRPRLSLPLTPATLPDISRSSPLSHGQLKELDRINRHEASDEPRLLLRFHDVVPDEPADGGKIAWKNVICTFVIAMNTQGLNMARLNLPYAFGVFQSFYEKTLLAGQDRSKIAFIGSVQLFGLIFMGIIAPPLVSRGLSRGLWGYLRPLSFGGTLLLIVTHAITGVCTSWTPLFFIQGILTGVAMGVVYHSCMAAMTLFFSTRLGAATCICMVGTSTGAILYTLLLGHLLPKIGFIWTMHVLTAWNMITMLPASVSIKTRFNWSSPSTFRINTSIFKSIPFMTMCFGLFFVFLGLHVIFFFITSYAQDILHMPPSSSTSHNLLLTIHASSLPGRILPSIISDNYLGPTHTLIATTLLASTLLLIWPTVPTTAATFILSSLYGFAAAGIQNLHVAAIFSCCGTDRRILNARMAVVFAAISVAGLTGVPLGGRLIDWGDGRYVYAQVFAGTVMMLGGVVLLCATVVRKHWKL